MVFQIGTLLPPPSPEGCTVAVAVNSARVVQRQLAQNLFSSRCLKPNPQDRHLGLCHPIAPVFLILRVSQHALEPGPRLSARINRRMRCSGESS